MRTVDVYHSPRGPMPQASRVWRRVSFGRRGHPWRHTNSGFAGGVVQPRSSETSTMDTGHERILKAVKPLHKIGLSGGARQRRGPCLGNVSRRVCTRRANASVNTPLARSLAITAEPEIPNQNWTLGGLRSARYNRGLGDTYFFCLQ